MNEKNINKSRGAGLRNKAIRFICMSGVFTALMCVLSPISIPVEPVSITLATLALYIIGSSTDWKVSLTVVALYLLLGLAGLPVFSKFQGGFQVIFGPSGGFLIGYLPCALVVSLLTNKWPNKKWIYPLSMVLGTILLYLIGSLWFMFYIGADINKTLASCVLPFIPGDIIKIVLSSFLSIRMRSIFNALG